MSEGKKGSAKAKARVTEISRNREELAELQRKIKGAIERRNGGKPPGGREKSDK